MKRYKSNPFVEDMMIPVGGKNVKISTLGKDDNILVNQHTGEITGTHVVARRKVDIEKFVKIFADYMSFTFDLTKAGNKALRVVMWALKEQALGRDIVDLDKWVHQSFLKEHNHIEPALTLSYPTFMRGLGELEKSKIIAKTIKPGRYFINPQCMFNGDRVAFTTLLERQPEEQKELPLDY